MTVSLSLPYPPSTNRLWRAVNGRNIKSKTYRIWEGEAVAVALSARPGKIPADYAIAIVADRPDRRRRDLGNLEKPTSDALVTAGIIADDCMAQRISLEWSKRPPGAGAKVHIALEPLA